MIALAALCLLTGQIENLESKTFSRELQVMAITASVEINNPSAKASGTGTILRCRGPFVYILTAAHVVRQAERLEITTFAPASYPQPEKLYFSAEVIARDTDMDIALVRLATHDVMPGSLPLCPPRLVPREGSFAVLTVGCSERKPPSCWIDRVIDSKWVRKEPRSGKAYVWEVGRPPLAGRSGGALLDQRGYLLGVCSGVSAEKGYYCHIDEIHRWLNKHGLEWLYDDRKKEQTRP